MSSCRLLPDPHNCAMLWHLCPENMSCPGLSTIVNILLSPKKWSVSCAVDGQTLGQFPLRADTPAGMSSLPKFNTEDAVINEYFVYMAFQHSPSSMATAHWPLNPKIGVAGFRSQKTACSALPGRRQLMA